MPNDDAKPLIVNEWTASFHWIQTPVGLVVDSLEIRGARAKIETDPFAIKVDNPGVWEAFIEEAALQMFIENKVPESVRDVQVKLEEGAIRVHAKAKLIVEIPVEAICSLRIEHESRIFVDVDSVSLGGSAAKNLMQSQLDKLNPVLDASDLPLNLRFQTVEIRQGGLWVAGTVEP